MWGPMAPVVGVRVELVVGRRWLVVGGGGNGWGGGCVTGGKTE